LTNNAGRSAHPEPIEGPSPKSTRQAEPAEALYREAPADSNDCHVCGQPLTSDIENCNNCDRPFHLRKREDSSAPDCGEVWINEQYLALEFACDLCLGKSPDPHKTTEPPIAPRH